MKITSRVIGLGFILATAIGINAQLILPQPTTEGIARAQIFDYKIQYPFTYPPEFAYIWGSRTPDPTPNIATSAYVAYARDDNRAHTLAWYQANHPDWVVYKADRATPAWGFTYANGNRIPIDITNPEAREFFWDTNVQPYIDKGFTMIALDNVELDNWDGRSGHFDKSGQWVQQFSGDRMDPAYERSVADWMDFLIGRLHSKNIAVSANVVFPWKEPLLIAPVAAVISKIDLWLDEQGFTIHRDSDITDDMWQRKFDYLRTIADTKLHVGLDPLTPDHLADASQQQIDWAVANYYLYRGSKSMLIVCGHSEYGSFLDTPAMHVNLGHPVAPPAQTNGIWSRRYSKGMTIVNPRLSIAGRFKLPKHTWVDNHGKEYKGTIDVSGNTGLLLMPKP